MEYGICDLAIVPMRAAPNERSEQLSQLLFGETFEIIEWKDKWVNISTSADRYSGWIDRLQFILLSHTDHQKLVEVPPPLTYNAVTKARKISDNGVMYLAAGSSLPFLEGVTSTIGSQRYVITGETGKKKNIEEMAVSYLNTPYLWGGRTHFGIDCSGFTQMVFKLNGLSLNRDASMQAEEGSVVEALTSVKAGDLAFFNNEEGRIIHVGMLLNNGQIIHASGKVKIDVFDSQGIYSEEFKKYTHYLRIIKRYF